MKADNTIIQLVEALPENKRYWICRQPFYLSSDQTSFRYRYKATFKKSMLTRVVNWFVGKEEHSCELITETKFRKSMAGTHNYDIFHFPANKEPDNRLFDGYLFFVDLLYCKGEEGIDFLQILIECQNIPLGLSRISSADSSRFLKWIGQVTSRSTTSYHATYICSILGQIVKQLTNHHSIFYHMQPQIADKLLDLLRYCQYHHIPSYNVEMIKSVSTHLVQSCSRRGWLSFLSYFANLFEVHTLLRTVVKLPESYSELDFVDLTDYVVALLQTMEDRYSSRKIPEFIIESCDFISCLWHLYRELSRRMPDVADDLRERFSRKFCKLISFHTRAQKIDLLQRNYWEMTPMEMRIELADSFVDTLNTQIKCVKLDDERIVMLKNYATDKDICASKRFLPFVRSLAENRNPDVFRILIDILDSERFFLTWKDWSNDEKSDICKSLLQTMFQFQFPFSRARSRDKILQVLEAEKTICETYALQKDQQMQLVLEKCAINLLQNVSVKSILDAFADVDISSQIMQSSYSLLLRDATKRSGTTTDGSLVKTLLHLLDGNAEKGKQKDVALKG